MMILLVLGKIYGCDLAFKPQIYIASQKLIMGEVNIPKTNKREKLHIIPNIMKASSS